MPRVISMRNLSLASALLAALLAAAPAAVPAAASEKAAAASKPVKAVKAAPESLLKPGMSVDEVKKVMGMPDEIEPMKLDVALGKAEIWTYKRQVAITNTLVQIGNKVVTITVKGPDGVDRQVPVSIDPDLRLQHTITDEVIQVLMFNDRYAEKKVTRQDRREYP